jgi:hypothetical protein
MRLIYTVYHSTRMLASVRAKSEEEACRRACQMISNPHPSRNARDADMLPMIRADAVVLQP